jgi:predicted ATP-grasp superfamily ATP-dependent carboligase
MNFMSSPHSCMHEEPKYTERKPTDTFFANKAITLVGYSIRSVNSSAKAMQLQTLCIDVFADMDLRRSADRVIHVDLDLLRDENGNLEKSLADYLMATIETNKESIMKTNFLCVGSGFENNPELIKKLEMFPTYLGNSAESTKKVRQVEKLFTFLMQNKIRFPKTISFSIGSKHSNPFTIQYSIYDADKSKINEYFSSNSENELLTNFFHEVIEKDIQFPMVIKSEKSGGGLGVYLINSIERFLERFQNLQELKRSKFLIQKFIPGPSMSCSFISNGINGKIVSYSKQIIGEKRYGCQNDFAYCGNIMSAEISNPETPKNRHLTEQMSNIIDKLIKSSGIVGSNGIDFILMDNAEVCFIELNPRFQATIDLFEDMTGENLLQMHLKSIINKELPKNIDYSNKQVFLKAIYYSPLDFYILTDIQSLNFRDVPLIGSMNYKGAPLCSSVMVGTSEIEAFEKSLDDRDLITRVLQLQKRLDKDAQFLIR